MNEHLIIKISITPNFCYSTLFCRNETKITLKPFCLLIELISCLNRGFNVHFWYLHISTISRVNSISVTKSQIIRSYFKRNTAIKQTPFLGIIICYTKNWLVLYIETEEKNDEIVQHLGGVEVVF